MDKNIDNIEGDGFLFHLFHLLWVKDPLLGFVPSLNVPDTILFKYDQPFMWYFVKDKQLKRKSKSKVNLQEIQRVFLNHAPKSGIIALYVSQYTLSDAKEKIVYEYMNKAEFTKFLFEKQTNPREGVLQRFIQPKSDHNFILRAIWGPTICLFEKIENLNNINDNRQDIYQRVLTFETDNTPSRNVPIRGYILPHLLENFVFNMVQHISNVTYDRLQVVRMVFNFKIDEHERIWFLFCSSLRLKNPSSVLHKYYSPTYPKAVYDSQQIEANIPPNIETQKLSNPQPLNLRKNFKCLNCEKEIDVQGLFKIKYKDVIKGWNFDHYDQKEPWEVMKALANNGMESKKSLVVNDQKNGSLASIKLKAHKNLNLVKNELLSKKIHNHKKNTQFVYKSLFNDFERENSDNKSNFFSPEPKTDLIMASLIPIEKGYVIPPLIKTLHPHIKEKEYYILAKNPGFLEKKALVCEDCFLKIIGSSNANESLKQMTKKHIIKNHEIVGKGKLNPEAISHRNEMTRNKILSQSNADLMEQGRICKRTHGDWCLTEEENDKNNSHESQNVRVNEFYLSENDIRMNFIKTPTTRLHSNKANEVSNNFQNEKKTRSSHFLNQILNSREEVNRKYLHHNLTKLEFFGSVLKKTNENVVNQLQGGSFEKISTIDTSEKELLEQDCKLENNMHFPKRTYLQNLSKHLNNCRTGWNVSPKSYSQVTKLYDSTKEKLKLSGI